MSARYYCDGCDTELEGGFDWSERFGPSLDIGRHRFRIERTIVSMDGVSNNGQLCRSCMAKLVTAAHELGVADA